MEPQSDSVFVAHEPCPACGSKDNLARYDDGHAHCFGCEYYEHPTGSAGFRPARKAVEGMLEAHSEPLGRRRISLETAKKFSYGIAQTSRGKVQVAPYFSPTGEMIAQHVRTADKDFFWIGDAGSAGLFGRNLWPSEGKRIVVTEGELDALSVAQAFGLKWPVVSVPGGAQSAPKEIAKALEFLSGYEQVVIWFDNDDPGRAAAAKAASLLPPGKAFLAAAPADVKDASDLLQAGRQEEITRAVWNARLYRPGGIVSGADVWDKLREETRPGLPYPWPGLTRVTGGQHHKSLVVWTSGTGMGKSTAVSQVAYDLAFPADGEPVPVGYVALEESVGRAAQRFLSFRLGRLVHMEEVPEADLRRAFDETLGAGRVWFYDHFGSTDSDDLIGKLRYLAVACGCKVIVLDHLSIVVSGMDLGADERRTIDRTMTMLRTFVEETGVILHVVSHLKRVGDGKSHEEGGRVTLADLRGSQAIAQLADAVIGLERNQQADGEEANRATIRVLKNRHSGKTGKAANIIYDPVKGRMEEDAWTTQDALEF